MPQNIREGLLDQMKLSFPHEFVHTKSATAASAFPCMHFTYYNRYSIHVEFFVCPNYDFSNDANFSIGYRSCGS